MKTRYHVIFAVIGAVAIFPIISIVFYEAVPVGINHRYFEGYGEMCADVETLPLCTSDRTACFNRDVNVCDPSGWECGDSEEIFEEIIENEN